MHVALLTNTAWLDEELAMFQHLVVGLLDEQVQVALVVPDRLPESSEEGLVQSIVWRDSRWPLMRRHHLVNTAADLARRGVDLIHALDGRLWDGALRLGERLEAPVILSAYSALDLALLDRLEERIDHTRVMFAAGSEPLAKALADRLGPTGLVRYVPPGIHVPPMSDLPKSADPGSPGGPGSPRSPEGQDQTTCIVVAGSGAIDDDYQALLEALQQIVSENAQVQLFFDSQFSDQHGLWQAARRFGLLANMSLVPRRLGHRELLLWADVLIHPQPLGRTRSLLIQAMARGMPVLARQDPWLDCLVDEMTCWTVEQAQPKVWVALIHRVMQEQRRARVLGHAARQWVRENRQVSDQVTRTLGMYQRIAGQPIKFPHG
ncbi:MAG: hypothetical protein WD042_00230 [Phycisphaeraceae bacterium]